MIIIIIIIIIYYYYYYADCDERLIAILDRSCLNEARHKGDGQQADTLACCSQSGEVFALLFCMFVDR